MKQDGVTFFLFWSLTHILLISASFVAPNVFAFIKQFHHFVVFAALNYNLYKNAYNVISTDKQKNERVMMK
jgi:hypothetical protein